MGVARYAKGFRLALHCDLLERPLAWRKPRKIFVNSMSDLFHRDVPEGFIRQVFEVMRRAHWHQFQILTKRAERLLEMSKSIDWPANGWMGVTVESDEYVSKNRVRQADKCAREVRFH